MDDLRKISIKNTAAMKRYDFICASDEDYQKFYVQEKESLSSLIDLCSLFDMMVSKLNSSQIQMGYILSQIHKKKLYENLGCVGIYQFAEKYCGLSRATVSRWMSVVDRFYDEEYCSIGFRCSNECDGKEIFISLTNFSIMKLYIIKDLPDALIKEYVKDSTTTCEDLQKLVSRLLMGIHPERKEKAKEEEKQREAAILEQLEEVEESYDPHKVYSYDFFKTKSKTQLIGYIIALQRTYMGDRSEHRH